MTQDAIRRALGAQQQQTAPASLIEAAAQCVGYICKDADSSVVPSWALRDLAKCLAAAQPEPVIQKLSEVEAEIARLRAEIERLRAISEIDRLLAEDEPEKPSETPGDEVLRGYIERSDAGHVSPVEVMVSDLHRVAYALCRRALEKP